jgi:hypothetical protein
MFAFALALITIFAAPVAAGRASRQFPVRADLFPGSAEKIPVCEATGIGR